MVILEQFFQLSCYEIVTKNFMLIYMFEYYHTMDYLVKWAKDVHVRIHHDLMVGMMCLLVNECILKKFQSY